MTRRLQRVAVLIALLLSVTALRAAALDPAYLSELPDPQRVIGDFQGSDRLDTLALQIAALTRLNRLVNEMAGDRYYTPGKFPTPDESRVVAAIRAVSAPLNAEAEATFDPKERGADSPRTKWRNQIRTYEASDQLYDRLMQLYFTPAFREAHAAKLAAKASSQARTRDDMARGQRALKGIPEPGLEKSHMPEIITGVVMIMVMLIGSASLIRVPAIRADAPHRFRVGLTRYTIESVTGVISNYSHREVEVTVQTPTTAGPLAQITKEAYEDFTLERPGASEPIHLATYHPDTNACMFARKVGQRITALWFVHKGNRYFMHFLGFRGPEPHTVTMDAWNELFPLPRWTMAAAFILGWMIGDLAIGSEFSGVLTAGAVLPVWFAVLKLLRFQVEKSFYRNQIEPLEQRLRAAAD